jgi:hypothetical protein
MELLKKIEADLKESMKSGDTLRSGTLKMLKTDITYEKVKGGDELTDEKILEVIARAAKRRKESITEFSKAGRNDLADQESAELIILETYLPQQMDETAIAAHIDKKLAGMPEATKNEFGAVMGQIMKDLKGKADGGAVRRILTERFEGK